MAEPTVGMIVNARAKRVRTGALPLDEMKKIGAGIAEFKTTDSFESLDQTLKEFRDRSIPYVGLLGGDGTLHQVISRMVAIYPQGALPTIALFRAGTMNNVSRSIGLRGNPLSIFKRLKNAIVSGQTIERTERDTMLIEDRLCFIFGLGFVTRFAQEAYAGSEKGSIQNIQTLFKAIGHAVSPPATGSLYEGITAEVSINDAPVPFHAVSAIIAGTVEGVGLGFYPMSRGNVKEGTFHAIVTGFDPLQIISRIPQLKRGKYRPHPLLREDLSSSLTIQSAAPFTYTMDGDMYDSNGSLAVRIGPRISFMRI